MYVLVPIDYNGPAPALKDNGLELVESENRHYLKCGDDSIEVYRYRNTMDLLPSSILFDMLISETVWPITIIGITTRVHFKG
jgi:hypothetical protein